MQVGDILPLRCQLGDYSTDKYVRAYLRDLAGNEISGSPVNLTHVALGLYQDVSLIYPDVPSLHCQFIVFDDVDYTVVSDTEGASDKEFTRDPYPRIDGTLMQVGAAIPVRCQLGDYRTDKYVRAYLRDGDGIALSGSPLALTHVALGLYQNNSLVFPDTASVHIQFVVYDDAGFTTVSSTEGGSDVQFLRGPTLQETPAPAAGFSTAALAALEAAIAQGVLRVKYTDKEVQYRSLSEMMQVRDLIRRELGIVSNEGTRVLAKFSRGT